MGEKNVTYKALIRRHDRENHFKEKMGEKKLNWI
jgi:hypothetical protein